jgi:60 kDa SS-A/Ro ribonucleoprotein
MSYLRGAPSRRQTPQSQPIPGVGQVPNSAGGHAWEVDPLTRLRRFLILGAEGSTYYASAEDHLGGNVACLAECDPIKAIDLIAEISHEGRAPKNDPAIFALAYYAAHESVAVRQHALSKLPVVCRVGTHIFHFAEFVQAQRGWGRSLRRAVGQWYASQPAADLAYQAVKYRQRDGWTHKDLLRLSHPTILSDSGNPDVEGITPSHRMIFDWITHRDNGKDEGAYRDIDRDAEKILYGFEQAQRAESPKATADLVGRYRLPREALIPEHLTSPDVWAALLDTGMPLTALIRNLPTMTRVGLLAPMSAATTEVLARLSDGEALRRSRVHPLSVLVAHLTYACGRSVRGSSSWSPVAQIVDALDAAFYGAFANVKPTGKRHLIALDVSGSMDGGAINGVPGLTPRVASSAMALVIMASGDPYECVAFTSSGGPHYARPSWGRTGSGLFVAPQSHQNLGQHGITSLDFSPKQRLADVCRATQALPFGGTDCALPWLYAAREGRQVDVCATMTDSETWAGAVHPSQALQTYRERSGINARSVVCGMVSNGFTVADPRDVGQMDVVGFDTATPGLIADFAAGRI